MYIYCFNACILSVLIKHNLKGYINVKNNHITCFGLICFLDYLRSVYKHLYKTIPRVHTQSHHNMYVHITHPHTPVHYNKNSYSILSIDTKLYNFHDFQISSHFLKSRDGLSTFVLHVWHYHEASTPTL